MWMGVIRLMKMFFSNVLWQLRGGLFDTIASTLKKKKKEVGVFEVFLTLWCPKQPQCSWQKHRSTFAPKNKNTKKKKSLVKMINDITLLINFSTWGGGLCGNYALQREEITGMLIMCEPLVWFCINWRKKKRICIRNSAIKCSMVPIGWLCVHVCLWSEHSWWIKDIVY